MKVGDLTFELEWLDKLLSKTAHSNLAHSNRQMSTLLLLFSWPEIKKNSTKSGRFQRVVNQFMRTY